MIASLLVGAACLLLFSPFAIRLGVRVLNQSRPANAAKITYQDAMLNLASVRRRILEQSGGTLDADVKVAIDTLTLALVAGSDR
jgi:hypothetical protein